MAKRFDKDPKKLESEDSGSESEDSEMETLPEEVEEEANRQKKKLLTRRPYGGRHRADSSGASTSTSVPPSDIYRPPTAETGFIPKKKSGLYGTGPPEWDSRTPSPFVRQFQDPKTGRQNWPAMQKTYEQENQGYSAVEASGESPEERGKYLAAKSRVHTSQAQESGRQSRQVELLKDKLDKGFVFEPKPHGKSVAEGRFHRFGFTPSTSRPRMQPQDPNREEDYARFSQKVKEMDKKKKFSAILPTGRMGYGPPSAAKPSRRSEPMDASQMELEYGEEETPEYWRPRDTDFADRFNLLGMEDQDAYQEYRQMANMAANRPARRRLTPLSDFSLQQHSRRRANEYEYQAWKNSTMEKGGRRDQLYQRSALPPAELHQRSPDTPLEPKLKDFKIGAISEYYPFEPFSEDPLTPIEMAPQSRAPTPPPSATSLVRRSPTSSPRRGSAGASQDNVGVTYSASGLSFENPLYEDTSKAQGRPISPLSHLSDFGAHLQSFGSPWYAETTQPPDVPPSEPESEEKDDLS